MKSFGMMRMLCFVIALFSFVFVSGADANLPSVCVQAQQAFNQAHSFTKTTIQTHHDFRQSWQKAFQTRATSQTFYSQSLSKFTSSKALYSSLKSHLSSKGFAISSSSSLKSLLTSKGYKFDSMLGKISSTGKPKSTGTGSGSAPKKSAPFDVKQVAKTTAGLKITSAALTNALTWLRKALTQLREAKNLGNQAKSKTTSARQYLSNAQSLLQKCQAELKKIQNAPKKRTSLPFSRQYARCGEQFASPVDVDRVYCGPCDPMRSSCESTCFFGNFNSMMQQTQSQQSQLNQAEKNSGSNGNVMFEIDMKIGQCEKDEQSAQSSSNETKDQLGSLGF